MNQEDKNLEPASPGASRRRSLGDGGSAFPTISTEKMWTPDGDHVLPDVSSSGGLSIRDWFAGKALSGMLSDSENSYSCTADETHWTQAAARVAYQMADAMLAARKAGA